MKKGLFIIAAAIMLFATPVFAGVDFNVGDAKATLGASVWVEAGWDFQFHGDVPTDTISDKQTQQYIHVDNPSNINLNVDYKNLGGYVEIRYKSDADYKIEMYSLYGVYKFDDKNQILFGQAPMVFSPMCANQFLYNNNDLDGYGGLDPTKRALQIRYSYKTDKIGFDFALEENKPDTAIEDAYFTENGNVDGGSFQVQSYLPGFDVSVTWKPIEMLTIIPSGYIQQYQLKPKGIEGINNTDVLTYALSLGVELDLKAVDIQAEGWWGQNISPLQGIDARPSFFNPIYINGEEEWLAPMGTPVWEGNELKDVTTYGGWLQVQAPVGRFTPRIGGGYQRSSTGHVGVDTNTGIDYRTHIFTWGAFANCDIKVKEYLNICPEFLYMFNGQDANKDFLSNGYSKLGYEAIGGLTMILTF
jgi:hypothetical protein